MAVYHISHHDPGGTYLTIHVSTISLRMHSACIIYSEMVKFLTIIRAGSYSIETGPGHCMESSRRELQRIKFNSPTPNMLRIHRRFQEAAPS